MSPPSHALLERTTWRSSPRPGWRALTLAAILALGLGLALRQSLQAAQSAAPTSAQGRDVAREGLLSMPLAARGPVSAALGADSPIYRVRAIGDGFTAATPAQHLHTVFTRSGVSVATGTTQVELSVRAFGYGSSPAATSDVAPRLRGGRVVYSHGDLSEWYANGPLGIEQGFSVARAPADRETGPLAISMAISGNAVPMLEKGGQAVALLRAGRPALRYSGLSATDARGRTLHSWLALRGGRLLVRVDTQGARYPLRIDPFIHEGELTVLNDAEGERFGESVAVSGDTIVVGEPQFKLGGAAFVFSKPASGWASATQSAELRPPDAGPEAEGEEFGRGVAVSGNTVLVGAPNHTVGMRPFEKIPGAAYVFEMPAAGWSSVLVPSISLSASDPAAETSSSEDFGWSVAMSGSTIIVGAPNHKALANAPEVIDDQGAAYVFVMPGTGWVTTTQTAELTPPEDGEPFPYGGGAFGWSVAMSGNTVVVGAPLHDIARKGQACESGPTCQYRGAAYVFVMPPSGWSNSSAGSLLYASDGSGAIASFPGDRFGESVAVSGATVLVGAPHHDEGKGAAYVYTEPASGWTGATQTAELTATDGHGEPIEGDGDLLGFAVGLEGNTAVAGAYVHGESGPRGALYLFNEPASGWTSATQTEELKPAGLSGTGYYGFSVAASCNTIVAGAVGQTVAKKEFEGAAYVYEDPQCAEGPTVTKTGGTGNEQTFVASTSSTTTTTAATTSTESTSAQEVNRVLACTNAQVVLINVLEHGGRVLVTGAVRTGLAGQTVKVKFAATGKIVGSTKIASSGLFSLTVPLPPAKIRPTNKARYEAIVGSQASAALKLERRSYLSEATIVGAQVQIAGGVKGSFKPGTPVVIAERLTCSSYHTLATVKLTRAGTFSATVPAPTGAAGQIALYRASTKVLLHRVAQPTSTEPLPPSV